jgi:hypothetical protein
MVLVVLIASTPLWSPLFFHVPGEQLAAAFWILLLGLPGIQLAASVISFLVVACFYPDKTRSLIVLSKITVWSFALAAIGLAVMWGFCCLPGVIR